MHYRQLIPVRGSIYSTILQYITSLKASSTVVKVEIHITSLFAYLPLHNQDP